MGTNGSFYQNGLPYGTAETGIGNVPPATPAGNANGSFYLNGSPYAALSNIDALTALFNASVTSTTASQAAAAASAAAAAASAATKPYFSASLSANQSPITSGVFTKVNINSVLVDSNGWFDNVTNFRYTPLLAGKYLIRAFVQGLGTTITEVDCDVRKNGAIYARGLNLAAGVATSSTVSIIISFNGTTDYVELFGDVAGTGTLSFIGGTAPIRTWFEAQYVGP